MCISSKLKDEYIDKFRGLLMFHRAYAKPHISCGREAHIGDILSDMHGFNYASFLESWRREFCFQLAHGSHSYIFLCIIFFPLFTRWHC